jgi:hypothetical protein
MSSVKQRRSKVPVIWDDAPPLPASECMTVAEAQAALGVRNLTVGIRSMGGHLERCLVDGQTPGVGRASVEKELEFWQHASMWRKLRRRLVDWSWF